MLSYWQEVLEWLAPSVHPVSSDIGGILQSQYDCIELEDWASLHSASPLTSANASPSTSTASLPEQSTSDLPSSIRQRRKGTDRHVKSASSPADLRPSKPASRSSSKGHTSSQSPYPSHTSFTPVLLIPGPGGMTTSLMFFPPDFSGKAKPTKQSRSRSE